MRICSVQLTPGNPEILFFFSNDPHITDSGDILRTKKKIKEASRGKEESLFYLCSSLTKHPAEETCQLKSWHAGRCLEQNQFWELSTYRCQLNMSVNKYSFDPKGLSALSCISPKISQRTFPDSCSYSFPTPLQNSLLSTAIQFA